MVGTEPADGATVTSAAAISVVFSEPFDPDTCDVSTLQLVRVGPEGQVFGSVDYEVTPTSTTAVALVHDGLPVGTWRLAVRTGVEGCLSSFGLGIEPFGSSFVVDD